MEINKLGNIRSLLEKELSITSDAKGVYDLLVENLKEENETYDISLGEYEKRMDYITQNYLLKKSKKFTFDEIKEIAKNKFARYIFYDLRVKDVNVTEEDIFPVLKRQIRECAHDNMDILDQAVKEIKSVGGNVEIPGSIHFHNWLFGLEKVAKQVSYHWGTPLEAVD
ncbi:MAG: hypothetical protein M1416_03625 [Candidatus Pacearchaeota archaeon]|nr:hypothetical protein [Candidatus Pacearchaeota archaeon]